MAHIFYDLDFTVSVFVVHEAKVVLIHHKKLGKWLPLGGHIEIGENPEEAALREVREESGLDVELLGRRQPRTFPGTTNLTAPTYLDIHDISGDHRHIGLIYFARSSCDQVQLAVQEHNEIRWFSAAELADPKWQVPEAIQFYAAEAMAATSSS